MPNTLKDRARKAAEEILSLIKDQLSKQLPFIQFHDLTNNDIDYVTAIIERHMKIEIAMAEALRNDFIKMVEAGYHLLPLLEKQHGIVAKIGSCTHDRMDAVRRAIEKGKT